MHLASRPGRPLHARSAGSSREGVAAVELALFLPLLIFLCLVGCDFARVFYYAVTINNCARNGALYANNPNLVAGTAYADTTAAAVANASNLSPAPTVSSTSGTDANGDPYIEVTVAYTFTTLIDYPGIPPTVPLSRTVRMMTAPQ